LALDLLSPLMDILSPKLRSINPALMSKKEKEEVKNLTEIMTTYSLNWKESNKSELSTANEVTTIVKLDPLVLLLSFLLFLPLSSPHQQQQQRYR
jgi:hypothetical protein